MVKLFNRDTSLLIDLLRALSSFCLRKPTLHRLSIVSRLSVNRSSLWFLVDLDHAVESEERSKALQIIVTDSISCEERWRKGNKDGPNAIDTEAVLLQFIACGYNTTVNSYYCILLLFFYLFKLLVGRLTPSSEHAFSRHSRKLP